MHGLRASDGDGYVERHPDYGAAVRERANGSLEGDLYVVALARDNRSASLVWRRGNRIGRRCLPKNPSPREPTKRTWPPAHQDRAVASCGHNRVSRPEASERRAGLGHRLRASILGRRSDVLPRRGGLAAGRNARRKGARGRKTVTTIRRFGNHVVATAFGRAMKEARTEARRSETLMSSDSSRA
jgi:hypothetical protein